MQSELGKRGMIYLLCLSAKNVSWACLIKSHFPLKRPVFNYWQIIFQFGPWVIAVINNRK